jgi:hypothetical protein
LVGRLGLDKGLRIVIVHRDEFGDGGFQLPHAGLRTPLNLPLREQGEPTLDLIQPGSMSRREVQMITRSPLDVLCVP